MDSGSIALGIMCKAPLPGACKTRLCPPLTPEEAAALSACFIADLAGTVADAAATTGAFGCAVYTPAGERDTVRRLLPDCLGMLAQRGHNLTERICHATAELLRDHGGIFLLNADSPTLPPVILEQAIAALRRPGDRIVLGPAIDGGYCLIGLKQPHFGLFDNITWSTGQVLAQTLSRVAAMGVPLTLLPPWYDVDDLATLQLLVHELFGGGLPWAGNGLLRGPAPRTQHFLRGLIDTSDATRFGMTAPLVRRID